MVNAIDGSQAGWTPPLDSDGDEVRRRAAAATATKVATAPPELPQGPDTNGALLVRAAQAQAQAQVGTAATPKPLLALGIEAAAVTPDQDTAVQKRMDAFFQSAVPTYHLPAEGGKPAVDVKVATPFQMVSETPARQGETDETTLRFIAHEASVKGTNDELKAIAREAGMGPGTVATIKAGRATPEQIRVLTQALLNHDKLPPATKDEPSEARVRRMMCAYGIGFDCAGYTQQALLAAHGITRAQAGLNPSIMNEDLTRLSSAHFSAVADAADARAGDVIVLGAKEPGEVGHRLLVFDRHDATPEELQQYCAFGDGAALDEKHVTVLSVDSSYGSSGRPEQGGVQRQTWLYDGKNWGTVIPPNVAAGRAYAQRVAVQDTPYDKNHRMLGIYRYSGAL